MNWLNILKNVGLRQNQRQGFRLDDKDEAYTLEDDKDCKKEMVQMIQKFYNFTKSETEVDHFGVNEMPYKINSQQYGGDFSYERDEYYGPIQAYYNDDPDAKMWAFFIEYECYIDGFENMPEEAACDFIEMLKNPRKDVKIEKDGYSLYCGPAHTVYDMAQHTGFDGRAIQVMAKEGIAYEVIDGKLGFKKPVGFIARFSHVVYTHPTSSLERNDVPIKIRQKLLNDVYPKLLKTTEYFDYVGVKFL